MRLILHDLEPMHWALAGVGIAGVTLALLLLASRRLGISTGFEDICSLVLPAPYFRRLAVLSGRGWRLPLLVGLVIGGFLSAVLGGGWEPTWALGVFDRAIGLGEEQRVRERALDPIEREVCPVVQALASGGLSLVRVEQRGL